MQWSLDLRLAPNLMRIIGWLPLGIVQIIDLHYASILPESRLDTEEMIAFISYALLGLPKSNV